MRIVSLSIQDGMFSKTYEFGKKCLIHSSENSKGKTTLIRMVLYSMGYNIPPTKKINFSKFIFELVLFTTEEIKLTRKDQNIKLETKNISESFLLPLQENELHSIIFDLENEDMVNNLLGCFYFDQEKGWTLLNKGTVIGKITFDVREFIRGVENIDCKDEMIELENLKTQIKKFTTMLDLSQYKKCLKDENVGFNKNLSLSESLEISLNDLEFKERELKQKINLNDEIIKNNNSFFDYIENSQLAVVINNEEYLITRDNLKNFSDITEFSENKRKFLKLELNKLQYEKRRIEMEIQKNFSLVTIESILDTFNSEVSNIQIDENAVSNTLSRLKKRKNLLEKIIEEKTKSCNCVQKLYNYIYNLAKRLDLLEYIENDKIFIFTSDLKGFSGAVLHKLVFVFKMSYLKIIDEKYNLKLPIILDSPKGKEVDPNNIKTMMKILNEDFNDHQIIIASIDDDYEINLENPYIELDKNGVLGDLK